MLRHDKFVVMCALYSVSVAVAERARGCSLLGEAYSV